MLAGVSSDHDLRLERGNLAGVSEDALIKFHEVVGVWDVDPAAGDRAAADLGTTAYPSVAACLATRHDLACFIRAVCAAARRAYRAFGVGECDGRRLA